MKNNDKTMSYIDIITTESVLEVETIVHHPPTPGWKWDYTATDKGAHGMSILLWLVTGGEASLKSKSGNFHLQRGNAMIMPFNNAEYHGSQNREKLFEVTWMIFKVFDKTGNPLSPEKELFYTSLPDLPFTLQLANRILLSNGTIQEHWLRVLLEEIKEQAKRENINETEKQIHNLCDKIRTNPERYRNISDLQQECHYSTDHLIRLFRRHKKLTPIEFIIQTRIDKARGLLLIPRLSIKQIAAQLGYNDQFSFSKQFKARTGLSPKAFRLTANNYNSIT